MNGPARPWRYFRLTENRRIIAVFLLLCFVRTMIITATCVAVIVVAVVIYLHQVYTTLSKVGVNHLPVIPILGHVFKIFQHHGTHFVSMCASAFPDDKYVIGLYEFVSPIYLVMELELLKKITVKDFEHFIDRRTFTTKFDPLFGRGLLNLKGQEWKEMRATLSPAFTSSKIRLMVPYMVEVGKEMIKNLRTRIDGSGNGYIDLELKDLTTRYANDVIASCAFGLKVDSHAVDNPFYLKSKDVTNFNISRIMRIFFYMRFPTIANMLKLKISAPETSKFFSDVVLTTMKDREMRGIVRHDMISILNDVKKGALTHDTTTDTDAGFATVEESSVGKRTYNTEWTDADLVAQAVLFLFAGFDTVSTSMTFILFELAAHIEVQDKLVKEIKEHNAKNGDKFDFNSIQSMKYLDMVVSEGLRLYAPAPILDRRCVRDYNLGKINKNSSKDLIIRKGDVIGIPVWAFHRNPKLFPNPETFDPERFSEENKHNINSIAFMPFGIGPRNCIGSRFALCEVKVMLYQLLRDFEVVPCKKTVYPPILTSGFLMTIKNGAWVRLKPRQ